jgi:hypothetical protein
VSSELEAMEGGPEEEELMLQGVRFAFRVHQVLHDWLQVEKRNHSSIMSSELY